MYNTHISDNIVNVIIDTAIDARGINNDLLQLIPLRRRLLVLRRTRIPGSRGMISGILHSRDKAVYGRSRPVTNYVFLLFDNTTGRTVDGRFYLLRVNYLLKLSTPLLRKSLLVHKSRSCRRLLVFSRRHRSSIGQTFCLSKWIARARCVACLNLSTISIRFLLSTYDHLHFNRCFYL